MAAIDIGAAAIDRPGSVSSLTIVSLENPANKTGLITSVEIWATTNLSDCEVATFYVVSGSNLSTRDTHSIGTVTAGSKQTFSGLDITVQVGDYIGIYFSSGTIEAITSAGTGIWYLAGDNIPCSNTAFNDSSDHTISLYGTGTTEKGNSVFFGTNF